MDELSGSGITAETRAEFSARIAGLGLRIQEPGDTPLFTPSPVPAMQPMHWRWADLAGLFDDLSRHLRLEPGGGRRTLKLTNPGLPYGTTPSFWASIQYILPGEVATAHRHSPEAFRFVMQGHGCRTTVDGANHEMNEGDLVLTPAWTWHDHVHHGDEPMIWLDVLDISLVRAFDAVFFEEFQDDVQKVRDHHDRAYRGYGSGIMRPPGGPSTSRANPLLAYPKQPSDAAMELGRGLPPDPFDDVALEYQNPATGGSAMATMSLRNQLIRPGFSGQRHRHTGSAFYWVIEGSGRTIVGDQTFDWTEGDFFVVPSWAERRHVGTGSSDARLFRVDDTPLLRTTGLYREEVTDSTWTPGRDGTGPEARA